MGKRLGLELGAPSTPLRELVKLARFAEEKGFSNVWSSDLTPRDVFTSLMSMALSTSKITVGTGIASVYWRTPVVTAAAIADVDEMSAGRAILGLGTGTRGWTEQFGIAFRRPVQSVRECVEIIRSLLDGNTVSYEGSTFSLKGYGLGFKPQRMIPIYVGGIGPRMITMAGEVADGIMLGSINTPEYVRFAVEKVSEGARSAGRTASEIDISCLLITYVSKDRREALKAVKMKLASTASSPQYAKVIDMAGFQKERLLVTNAMRTSGASEAAKHVSDQMAQKLCLVGTRDECERRLDEYVTAGLKLPCLYCNISGQDIVETYRNSIDNLHLWI